MNPIGFFTMKHTIVDIRERVRPRAHASPIVRGAA
jgi:hypothetical protein